jgi:hypothetical protein
MDLIYLPAQQKKYGKRVWAVGEVRFHPVVLDCSLLAGVGWLGWELGYGFLHFRLQINLPFSKMRLDRSDISVIIGSGDSLKRRVCRKVC